MSFMILFSIIILSAIAIIMRDHNQRKEFNETQELVVETFDKAKLDTINFMLDNLPSDINSFNLLEVIEDEETGTKSFNVIYKHDDDFYYLFNLSKDTINFGLTNTSSDYKMYFDHLEKIYNDYVKICESRYSSCHIIENEKGFCFTYDGATFLIPHNNERRIVYVNNKEFINAKIAIFTNTILKIKTDNDDKIIANVIDNL